MSIAMRRGKTVEPHDDYGFFGPDSVTWKVWSYPTSLTVGFQRAVVIEELDPALIAAVDKTQGVYSRPGKRYDRTLRYFAMVAFGDTASTSKAADVLVKVHSKGIGIEPLSGNRYDANDPHSQLWIHMTAWHSILKAYEVYGPGPLPADEEARYWQECRTAAELQTCDPQDVPLTRDGVRAYFDHMRPKLAGSEAAQDMMHFLLDAEHITGELPAVLKPANRIATRVLRMGTIATMPLWMRRMAGIRQPVLVDALVRPLLRTAFALVHRNARLKLAFLGFLSPSTAPVVAPIFLGVPPRRPEVLTPAEARERYGYDRPSEAHRAWREQQAERVFGNGEEPSDAGLLESEAILGAI